MSVPALMTPVRLEKGPVLPSDDTVGTGEVVGQELSTGAAGGCGLTCAQCAASAGAGEESQPGVNFCCAVLSESAGDLMEDLEMAYLSSSPSDEESSVVSSE